MHSINDLLKSAKDVFVFNGSLVVDSPTKRYIIKDITKDKADELINFYLEQKLKIFNSDINKRKNKFTYTEDVIKDILEMYPDKEKRVELIEKYNFDKNNVKDRYLALIKHYEKHGRYTRAYWRYENDFIKANYHNVQMCAEALNRTANSIVNQISRLKAIGEIEMIYNKAK
ncbi:MAG: hypothetical protein RR191_06845 [Cetobacterium sp.]